MPELLEKEAFEETEITITKEYTNEDLLDRQSFIDKVKTIIEFQAAQKKNCCFAINGSWGVGKTFVLNKLEEQLELETNVTDKYLIFRYNCWQYDYYEEPLVAIVSSMLDTIDEKEKLISKENKAKIKGVLKAVGSALLIKANETIEDKTGFNPKELIDIVTDAGEFSAEQIEDEHKYDSNFIFKATLKKLQDTLKTLSADKTIIFIVDELDRCLPEYAIKVLERLHHIFEEVSNVQVILSIDKGQLKHIVKNTFGEGTEAEKYLSKFIRFYMNLDDGSFNDDDVLNARFNFYLQNFEYLNKATVPYHVEYFKTQIFDGIDIRSRIEIVEKCNLLHRILNKECQKSDFSIMCIEIFLVLLCQQGLDKFEVSFNKVDLFKSDTALPVGIIYLIHKLEEEHQSGFLLWHSINGKTFLRANNVFSLIYTVHRTKNNNFKDIFVESGYDSYKFSEVFKYVNNFRELLSVIN